MKLPLVVNRMSGSQRQKGRRFRSEVSMLNGQTTFYQKHKG